MAMAWGPYPDQVRKLQPSPSGETQGLDQRTEGLVLGSSRFDRPWSASNHQTVPSIRHGLWLVGRQTKQNHRRNDGHVRQEVDATVQVKQLVHPQNKKPRKKNKTRKTNSTSILC